MGVVTAATAVQHLFKKKKQAGVTGLLLCVNSCQAEPPKKPSNWRKKHEDFIATIRAAKVVSQVIKDGGPLPPPPPPTYDPGNG